MTARVVAVLAVACLLGACARGERPGEAGGAHGAQEPGREATQQVSRVGTSAEESAEASSLASAEGEAGGREIGAEGAGQEESDVAPPASDARVDVGVDTDQPLEEDAVRGSPEWRESPSGLRVLRAYVCKGIDQSEPTDAGKNFAPEDDGVLRLCCFSEIAGASEGDTIYHVWRWGDREMARVPLQVKGSRWRTWSSKRILEEWGGEWHVDIVDDGGVLLATLDFSVE